MEKDRGVWFEKSHPPRVHDDREKARVTKIRAELLDVAAAVGHNAQLKTALDEGREQLRVVDRRLANGRDETFDEMLLEIGILQSEMRELPFHEELDHLREVRGCDIFVQRRSSFRLVERVSDRIARKLYAESFVEREEAIEPMQAIAVECAAHVEKDRANHRQNLIDHRPVKNLRSALRCQSHSAISPRFIGTKTNAKNKSIRCRHTNTPMA